MICGFMAAAHLENWLPKAPKATPSSLPPHNDIEFALFSSKTCLIAEQMRGRSVWTRNEFMATFDWQFHSFGRPLKEADPNWICGGSQKCVSPIHQQA